MFQASADPVVTTSDTSMTIIAKLVPTKNETTLTLNTEVPLTDLQPCLYHVACKYCSASEGDATINVTTA